MRRCDPHGPVREAPGAGFSGARTPRCRRRRPTRAHRPPRGGGIADTLEPSVSTPVNRLVIGHDPSERSSWISIGVYVLVAFGLAWLACLPLWLGDGLRSPWMVLCAA